MAGQTKLQKRTSRKQELSTSEDTITSETSVKAIAEPVKASPQRVFLYIQLNAVEKLPATPHPFEFHLYHMKNTLQKMQERYTTDLVIYQHEFTKQAPSFTLGIIQDSIDDINRYSDNPLIVTLYERIPRHAEGTVFGLSTSGIDVDTSTTRVTERTVTELTQMTDSTTTKRPTTATTTPPTSKTAVTTTDPTTNPTTDPTTDPTTTTTTTKTSTTTTRTQKKTGRRQDTKKPSTHSSSTKARSRERTIDEAEGEQTIYIEEHLEFVSRGHCDLLQLFQHKRFLSNIEIYLYPYYRTQDPANEHKITSKTHWHMYSVLPIMKNFVFTNLAFVTFESIYNAPDYLHQHAVSLGLNLFFRSKDVDKNGDQKIVPLCGFYGLSSQIISTQNINIVWESIKRDLNTSKDFGHNQMATGSYVKLPRLFRQLLCTEHIDFSMQDIDSLVDKALINNSWHRYVLDEELRAVLESACVNSQFELLVQLYYEAPDNVLCEGSLQLEIFGYPNVNYCRFATLLMPVDGNSELSDLMQSGVNVNHPMFAIIKICFFQPITQRNPPLHTYNENKLQMCKLRQCLNLTELHEEDDRNIVRELYRDFQDLISEIVAFIVRRNVQSMAERSEYFCCQLGNLRNLLLKMCGWDFNLRMPTSNNIEFREMLTHMHRELMDIIYNTVSNCRGESLSHRIVNQQAEQLRIIYMMDEYRLMCVVGDTHLAELLYEELKTTVVNKMLFNFYVFLDAMENLNYEVAGKYLLKPKDRDWDGDYFASLAGLYTSYMLQLQQADTAWKAYADLIDQLRLFTNKNPLDQDAWILLYCLYKRNGYLPGMEYTRWKFENLYDVPRKLLVFAPRSLYELYLPNDFEVQTQRGQKFYQVFKLFARLGAYGFAEIVFEEVALSCNTIDAYLISTTLKMLQHHIDYGFQLQKFKTNDVLMLCYLAHINGNVEYTRGAYNEAITHFTQLLSIMDPEQLNIFNLSLTRLARLSFEMGDYLQARQAYELCLPADKAQKNFMANLGMGLSLYYMNQLNEAISYLARCTDGELFVPDVWGYLAIANLRLSKNKLALDCWKMAKLYPEKQMHERIYIELDKIKYSDVNLYVDFDIQYAQQTHDNDW